PEKRNFFLENSDIFDGFGIPPTRPFFSRQIGLDASAGGQPVPIPIIFGARLTGNVSEKLRIGLLSMQTGDKEDIPAQNISVAAFQQRIWKRSSITGIFVNQQEFDGFSAVEQGYARNGGLEFNYLSEDGIWAAWGQFHAAFKPQQTEDNLYYSAGVQRTGRHLEAVVAYSATERNHEVEVGFNPRLYNYDAARDTTIRLGYNILYNSFSYNFFPKRSSGINQHGISLESVWYLNGDYTFNEWQLPIDYSFSFSNQSFLSVGMNINQVLLPFPTDLIGGDKPLPARFYAYTNAGIEYQSDQRKKFSYSASVQLGEFYNGNIQAYEIGANYRVQPWGNFALTLNQNSIKLAEGYGETNLFLISPRVDINFSRNLFWTTFLQINTQLDNFNINSRLQWRFSPMSDLFVVYTDDYLVQDAQWRLPGGDLNAFRIGGVKNRALVIKLNYWLTL
ncbi:MAG: hypothetical protein AAF206_21370, partial [Bacteroidota bacterium]